MSSMDIPTACLLAAKVAMAMLQAAVWPSWHLAQIATAAQLAVLVAVALGCVAAARRVG
jgi:hypothetical protein